MQRFSVYIDLALRDVVRLWSATQLQIIIIAGICLPILMLLGLKRGHVAELREELVTSPTGRQLIAWTASEQTFLTEETIKDIETSFPTVDLIIPEVQRTLFYEGNGDVEEETISIYSTIPGDPILRQFDAEIDAEQRAQIVISESFAERHGFILGDSLPLIAKRRLGNDRESHQIVFKIAGILPTDTQSSSGAVGYASLDELNLLEIYAKGAAIAEWGIPAMSALQAEDSYEKMVCVCFNEPGSLLTDSDRDFLEGRGLEVTDLSTDADHSFFDLLAPEKTNEIVVYLIESIDDGEEGYNPIFDSPSLLGANTEAIDDLFIRWCDPIDVTSNDKPLQLIGVTLPKGRQEGGWIQSFLRSDLPWFDFDTTVENPFQYKALDSNINGEQRVASSGNEFLLQPSVSTNVDSTDAPTTADEESDISSQGKTSNVIHIPINLASFLNQLKYGLVEYDDTTRLFMEKRSPLEYAKARIYATTIDDVPGLVDGLSSRNFAVLSESSRIAEIQEQDQSLEFLVLVVAFGVFVFGTITVFSVLVDSTDRKRATIGILRVMGTSKVGIFVIVVFRAVTIGLLAAVLCDISGLAVGYLLSSDSSQIQYLAWKPTISLTLTPSDLSLVSLGAMACAIFGSFIPAVKASRLDPFEAIMEGRFH